jgi:hypothetical protein
MRRGGASPKQGETMDSHDMKQSIDRIEECADEVKKCVQSGAVPQDLRQAIDQFHQQASQAKQRMDGSTGEGEMRNAIMQMEQSADRMKAACASAGSNLDPKLQQAVQRAHDEASRLKKQVQAGSPA